METSYLCCLVLLFSYLFASLARPVKNGKCLDTRILRLQSGKRVSHRNVPPEEIGVEGSFESDIKLTPEQLSRIINGSYHQEPGSSRFKRKAVTDDRYLWPHKTVVYEFDPNLPYHFRSTIYEAMNHWQELSCIQFREYSPSVSSELGHDSRVRFYRGHGCQSSIGRIGGLQETSIGDKCNNKGSVSHEIGHILGFYHEQSRPDRDEHVTVHPENVKPDFHYNFLKYGWSDIITNEPYDVGSIMHYGSLYYSKDGHSPTITPNNYDLIGFMGQRNGLSFIDVKTANDLYQCSAHCTNSIQCNNEGVVGPDCSCLCPWGLTGYSCDEVQYSNADCGGVLRERDGIIQSPGYPNSYHDDTTCHWLILGPPGSTIKLWFNHFEMEEDYEGPCDYDWLEIRTLGPHLSGLKLCGSGPSTSFDYPGNALYLRFHSDESYSEYSGFEAGYSISETYTDYDW